MRHASTILEGERAVLRHLRRLGLDRSASWLRSWRRKRRTPELPVVVVPGSNRLLADSRRLTRWAKALLNQNDSSVRIASMSPPRRASRRQLGDRRQLELP